MARGATHVLGLDIGTQAIKAVELRLAGGEVHLVGRPVVIPTPEHSVTSGRIVDVPAVTETLTELLAEYGFGTRKVVASVGGDTDVVVRIIEVPQMTGKELDEAIGWELERQVPFPVDQAVFDYKTIERPDTPEDADKMEVLLAVAQEELVMGHLEAIKEAKLKPISVDVEPLAISRALVDAAGDAFSDRTVVNVHIGATATAILIVRKGLLAFVRTIPVSGQQLTAAVRQNVAEDEASAERVKRLFANLEGTYAYEGGGGHGYDEYEEAADTSSFDAVGDEGEGDLGDLGDSVFEVSDGAGDYEVAPQGPPPDEAVTQLDLESGAQSYQLPPEHDPATTAAEPQRPPVPPEVEAVQSAVYEAIAQPLLDLATEVRRSLDFYRRSRRNEDVDLVVLSGGSASIPGLASFIGAEIGVPTEVANPFGNVVVDDEDLAAEYLADLGPLCVIAVGLAMRDMFG
jgi:type IV pilus assembly protein PilM